MKTGGMVAEVLANSLDIGRRTNGMPSSSHVTRGPDAREQQQLRRVYRPSAQNDVVRVDAKDLSTGFSLDADSATSVEQYAMHQHFGSNSEI